MARAHSEPGLDEGPVRPPATPSKSGIVTSPGGAKKKILVADDDDSVRRAIVFLLTDEGYDVTEVSDGARALELVAHAADHDGALPDVVVLDFVMPGYSGLGILRAMKRFDRLPPTIVITGFSDPSVERFARSFGALRVLHKPVDEEHLLEAVHEALRHGAGAGG